MHALYRTKLRDHMNYCVEHPDEVSKVSKVKAQVSEVKNIMMDNIEKVSCSVSISQGHGHLPQARCMKDAQVFGPTSRWLSCFTRTRMAYEETSRAYIEHPWHSMSDLTAFKSGGGWGRLLTLPILFRQLDSATGRSMSISNGSTFAIAVINDLCFFRCWIVVRRLSFWSTKLRTSGSR